MVSLEAAGAVTEKDVREAMTAARRGYASAVARRTEARDALAEARVAGQPTAELEAALAAAAEQAEQAHAHYQTIVKEARRW